MVFSQLWSNYNEGKYLQFWGHDSQLEKGWVFPQISQNYAHKWKNRRAQQEIDGFYIHNLCLWVVGSKQKNEITAGEMSFCPDIIGYGLSLSNRVRSLVILEGLRGVLLPLQRRWFGDLTRILTWLYNWKEAPDSMLGRLCLSAWLGMPQCPPKRAGGGGWREGGNSA